MLERTCDMEEIDLEKLVLRHGSHNPAAKGTPPEQVEACVMEMVAYLAGESWSDKPKCACPVITAAMITMNDRISSDERRSRVMRPLIRVVTGTRSTKAVEKKRGYFAADHAVHVRMVKVLRRLGREAEAKLIEEIPPIVD